MVSPISSSGLSLVCPSVSSSGLSVVSPYQFIRTLSSVPVTSGFSVVSPYQFIRALCGQSLSLHRGCQSSVLSVGSSGPSLVPLCISSSGPSLVPVCISSSGLSVVFSFAAALDIKVPYAKDPALSKVSLLACIASPTGSNSAFLFCAFSSHSVAFFSNHFLAQITGLCCKQCIRLTLANL